VRTLVLWDVDHTLISMAGLSRRLYAAAFAKATGRALERMAPMAGRTERAIAAETLTLNGLAASEPALLALCAALAAEFAAHEARIGADGRALPGAAAALAALARRPDAVQSVLTGNIESVARRKLAAFGLARHIDFAVGAYGMDHADRHRLVRLAQERATAAYGQSFTRDSTVLIGDTPNDVAAAHLGGARVVAVATGFSDRATLTAAGADVVLDDLTDTAAVLAGVLGAPVPHTEGPSDVDHREVDHRGLRCDG
jgi:phosphoglycolate phosphatase-like HAD superfamily hydrolase